MTKNCYAITPQLLSKSNYKAIATKQYYSYTNYFLRYTKQEQLQYFVLLLLLYKNY
jgi:hypothetical protein